MTATIWSVGSWRAGQGITLPPDDLGCVWYVDTDTGWNGSPSPRSNPITRAAADGVRDGAVWQEGRSIVLDGKVWAPTQTALHQAMDRISSLLVAGSRVQPLVVAEAHATRQAMVRRDAETLVDPVGDVGGKWEATWSLQLFAPDSRRYSAAEYVLTTNPYSGGDGRVYPRVFPLAYGALGSQGSVFVPNAGTADAGLVATFAAGSDPLVNPTATVAGVGWLRLNTVLQPGDQPIVVDTAAGSVLQGGASRRVLLSGAYALIPPGGARVVFDADVPAPDAVLTIASRDAYA